VKVNRRFGGTYRLHRQGRITGQELIASCLFLALLSLLPWRWRWYILPKRRLTFTVLRRYIPKDRTIKHYIFIVFYYGHPCDNFCCLHCFEVRSIAKCIGMVVYSRLIARGKVCGPLVGRGLISFLKSIRRSGREWVKERISKEIASEKKRKLCREDTVCRLRRTIQGHVCVTAPSLHWLV
jgi:hypothetical protein